MEEMKLRTLSVLVDNEAGVLSQISRLFSRKGFNVESLAVGATDHPEISRMTIEVMANENQTNLMCNQLAKMVPVHSVKLLVPSHSIRRELVLYKVRAKNSEDKNEIIQIANIFRGPLSGWPCTSAPASATRRRPTQCKSCWRALASLSWCGPV